MRHELTRHPDTPSADLEIEVEVTRTVSGLALLRYRVMGEVDALALPRRAWPDRVDELWKRTCFEAFLHPPGGEAYQEFNLSPSTEWAAYRFDRYREGMAPLDMADPEIAAARVTGMVVLTASLPLGPGRLGLSAVVEQLDGTVSYWALAHPPGRPDFHHPDCFAIQLPATGPA